MLFTSFKWTRNGVSYTNTNKKAIPSSNNDAFQNSLVQQNVSSPGPGTLVYNCTVVYSINGSLITSGSNQTTIIVKGELK